MNEKFKAKDLRKKYFENYVTFEYEVRNLSRRLSKEYKTHGKSLLDVINDIGVLNYKKGSKVRVNYLKAQRKVRNWLAHSPPSLIAPKKYVKYMEDIENFILEIKNLNKINSR